MMFEIFSTGLYGVKFFGPDESVLLAVGCIDDPYRINHS
jgi:hypothetical protein